MLVGMPEAQCARCGTRFAAKRSTARYCCGACRVAEHRRQARNRVLDQRKDRACLMCETVVIDFWERPDKNFCSNACRQKWYRDCGGPPIPADQLAAIGALAAEFFSPGWMDPTDSRLIAYSGTVTAVIAMPRLGLIATAARVGVVDAARMRRRERHDRRTPVRRPRARCERRYATSVYQPLGVVTLDLTP
jgi:hypothetical protein